MASVRQNGLIRIPERFYSQVCTEIIDIIYVYRDRFAGRLTAPIRERSIRSLIPSMHEVYGVPLPDFHLQVVFSASEGSVLDDYPDAPEAQGWFIAGDRAEGRRPRLAIVVSPAAARAPEKALRGELGVTLQHELRHLIQYTLSKEKEDLNRAGGPPRKARSAASVINIEYQPTLGDLLHEYRSALAEGDTTLERALREISVSELLQQLKEESPALWKAAMRTAHAELSKVPLRRNGIIRLPDGLLDRTLRGLAELLKRLRSGYGAAYPESPPSASDDPHLRDMRRRQAALIRGDYSVYGKEVPPFVLAAWLSVEGLEVGGHGLWRAGWFTHTPAGDGTYIPLIGVAVALGHMRKPDSVLYDPEIRELVAHELRHLIQYTLDPNGVIDRSTTKGGPPRAATSKRISKRRGLPAQDSPAVPDEHGAYASYVTRDIEFQPHLASLVERLCRKRDPTTTTASLMKEALASPLLEQWRQHAPEKWRAAVKIIAAALEDRHPLPSYAKARIEQYLYMSPEQREFARKEGQRQRAWRKQLDDAQPRPCR